jgi:serine/threonine protein kinase/tetratricopeptide (TPR) repeat protein
MSGASPERYRQVDALFDAALDLPEEERADFLQRATAADAELRTAVERLLRAHARSEEFLQAPAVEVAAPLLRGGGLFEPRAAVPERVGAFRIVREIGRGGMGAVYLGERADGQFAQRVAVKLVRRAGDEPELVRRFLEERRILALLEHPRIARLIDGGLTADGQPYFAMEYVEGEPVDGYCDARALSIGDRLELFADVCDAVQYAHQHLVVHRDLKPSNILVTKRSSAGADEPGSRGEVKLLDFGIAKLLDPLDAVGEVQLTRTGVYPMTPDYAAPEQVRGEPVSTATDIYALGVLLYSLLTGRRPYEVRGRSPAEVERIICGLEPPRPSATFAGDMPEPERTERARARGGTPERLRRQLRGDLELIVMKALHKEQSRRYPSAAALRDDLQRYRGGEPVQARPDSAGYRARRFVGRHHAGVAVAAASVLVLAGAALRERTLRGRAEAETLKARAVQEYVVSVFDVSDPFATAEQSGQQVTARALLDRGAARVDSALAAQPEVQAELRGVLGRVYANLSLFDLAVPQLERSLEQRRALYGPRHPAVAEAMDRLGNVLLNAGRADDAEPLLREALALRRTLLGSRHPATAESLDHLATLLQELSRYDEAEPLFREALATRRALLGVNDPDVATSLNNLGLLLYLEGAYDDAEPLQREALTIQERRLGAHHPRTAQTLNNLAQLQQMRGQIDDAEALFRRALDAKRAVLGDAHPSVTIALNNLAWLLFQERGRVDEPEALTREALALDRQIFGEPHTYVASSMSNLAVILAARGALEESERLHRQVLAMRRTLYGERHGTIARTLSLLAGVRHLQGDLAEAGSLYRASTEQYRELLGEDHPNHVIVTVALARVLRERGELQEAERRFRAATARLDPNRPPQYMALVSAHIGLGQLLAARGRAEEALPLLEQALEMSRERFGEESWRTAEARLALGVCVASTGQHARAEPLLRQANQVLLEHQPAQPRLAAQAHAAVATLYPASRRPRAAPTSR